MTVAPPPADVQLAHLLDEATAFVANPFELPPDRQERAARFVRQFWPSCAASIRELIDGAREREARRLLLAAGMVQLLTRQARLLGSDLAPPPVFESLRVVADDLRALILAARRCELRLAALAGSSAVMQRLRARVWRACFGSSLDDALRLGHIIREQNVLILGETGTGKELVASAILAAMASGPEGEEAPRQSINAAALPADLVESELFGHVKGAFSDAVRTRAGKIAAAHRGGLFLDEIGDLPLAMQPKLLRAIESNRITPVGSNEEIAVDVRYIAATSRPLREMAERGEFRLDLYQRLAGLVVEIPPLRERLSDVPAIAHAIVGRLADERTRLTRRTPSAWLNELRAELDEALANDLGHYGWPGNVRELENWVRTRMLGLDDPPQRGPETPADEADEETRRVLAGAITLEQANIWYVGRVVSSCEGNQSQAARRLDIDRGTLARYLKLGQAGPTKP